jgi:TetR/AcrR family transcriptional regulator, transcriptional repressor for nem operon
MARYKPEHKKETRSKVVDGALDHFRQAGIDSTSIDTVMRGLGLTVGGFYRHFGSKSELLAEAVAKGVEQSTTFIRSVPVPADGRPWFAAVAERYLSAPHRDNIARGCALAALGPEIARSDPEVRAACEAGLQRLRDVAREHLGARADEELTNLWALVALNMGGLILSRMVADPNTANEILRSCREGVTSLASSLSDSGPARPQVSAKCPTSSRPPGSESRAPAPGRPAPRRSRRGNGR